MTDPMNELRNLVHDALDGRLNAAEEADFEARLATDERLAALHAEELQLRHMLRGYGLEAPRESIADRVRAALAAEGATASPAADSDAGPAPVLPLRRPFFGLGFMRVAAVLIALCLVVPVLLDERGRGAMPDTGVDLAEVTEDPLPEASSEDERAPEAAPGLGVLSTTVSADKDIPEGEELEEARAARLFSELGAWEGAPPRPRQAFELSFGMQEEASDLEVAESAALVRLELLRADNALSYRRILREAEPPVPDVTSGNFTVFFSQVAPPEHEILSVVIGSLDRLSSEELKSPGFQAFAAVGDQVGAVAQDRALDARRLDGGVQFGRNPSAGEAPSEERGRGGRDGEASGRPSAPAGPGAGGAPGGPGAKGTVVGGLPDPPGIAGGAEGGQLGQPEAARARRGAGRKPAEVGPPAPSPAEGPALRAEIEHPARKVRLGPQPERRFCLLSGPGAVGRVEQLLKDRGWSARFLDVEGAFGPSVPSEAERPLPSAVPELEPEAAPEGYRVLEIALPPAELDRLAAALEDLSGTSLKVLASRAEPPAPGAPALGTLVLLVLER